MKKYLFAITAALLSLAACNKEIVVDEPINDNETAVLTFTSARPQFDADTRTSWNGTAIEWTADVDKIKVGFTFDGDWWGQTAAYGAESASPNNHIKFYQSNAVIIDDTDACLGTFKVPTNTFTGPTEEGDFIFYALFPYTAIPENDQDAAPVVNINVKSDQTPAANSFDGSADVMVGKSATITSTGLPSTAIDLDWTRIVAHGLFTLKDFQGVEAGETITNVVFTAQEGANLTGEQTVSIADGTVTATSESSNSITLEGTNLAFVTEDGKTNLKVWLSVIPARLTSLNVLVTTSKATYAREITGIDKTLLGNACNKLGINMSTATRTAQAEYSWEKKDLSAITADDVFVIVGNNGANYAMSNDNGTTNPPAAVAVKVSGNKLASNPAEKLQWTLTKDGSNYTFYPNGTTATWLYCTATNNGVRVGVNTDNKTFSLDESGYLKNNGTSRFLGVYNSQDWRCYTTSTATNIKDQTFAFYVRKAGSSKPAPTITFSELTTEVNVGESVTNTASIEPATLTVTYSSEDSNIATVDATGKVTGVAAGSTTITASYAGDDTYDEASASYRITVVAPVINHGSVDEPISPAAIVSVIDGLEAGVATTDFYYVEGVLDADPSYFGNGKLTFTFVDSEGNNQIKAYNCKGLDGANFNAKTDLKVGDYVIVYGNLEKYVKNDVITYEIVNGQLAKLTPAPDDAVTISWSRSGSTDTVTEGYELFRGNQPTANSNGYYKEGGTVGETVNYIGVQTSNLASAMFASTPTSVTLTARLGAGSDKDALDNAVKACLIDADGNDIASTVTTITASVKKNATDYTVSIPVSGVSSAYGIKLYHTKESSWNVFYYGLTLVIK